MMLSRLKDDLAAATKNGEVVRRDTVRLLLSAVNYKQIDLQHDLSDEEVLAVINSEAKKRRESIDIFSKNNRLELVEKEKAELAILESYLPKQLSEEEIRAEIARLDLTSDFAGAMKIAAPHFKGRADGKLVAKIINEKNS